jgi:glycosyltransferase involved in cell wall biosynthesis
MPRPLVSIIIPCWNAEANIGEAIESALAQTYPNVEVIAIDDGSTDRSLDVIKSYGNRLRYESGPNSGASSARNRGLALANGELIQFLDADDRLFPNKLEVMVPLAVAEGPSSSLVCGWEWVNVGGVMPSKQEHIVVDNADSLVWCLRNRLQTSSPLHWRMSLSAIGGYDTRLPCCQDLDLHLRLAANGTRFFPVHEILYQLRSLPVSISSDYVQVLDWYEHVLLNLLSIIEANGSLTDTRRMAIAELLAQAARHYFRRGHTRQAERYFELAAHVHSTGGLSTFGKPLSRLAARLVGPMNFEKCRRGALRTITLLRGTRVMAQ